MIYSEDINKICAVCALASETGEPSRMHCSAKKQRVPEGGTCPKFRYDILKRHVRRQRRLRTDFTAEDFKV